MLKVNGAHKISFGGIYMDFLNAQNRFLKEVAWDSRVWDVLKPMMKSLQEQGVFDYFVNPDKLDQINEFLKNHLHERFKPKFTRKSYTSAFAFFILARITEQIYTEDHQDAKVDDVVEAIHEFEKSPNWASVFSWFWITAETFKNVEYTTVWKTLYKKHANPTANEMKEYELLVNEVFPMREPCEKPSYEWLDENIGLLEAVDLNTLIDEKFMDSVFYTLAEMYGKTLDTAKCEDAKMLVQPSVKLVLFLYTIKHIGKSVEELTYDGIVDGVESFNKQNPQYVMLAYYSSMIRIVSKL